MSEPLTDLEKYNRGLPLSDENAALMEGREPVAEFDSGETKANGTAPLSDDEKQWLHRLIHEPGFPILLGLLNRTIQIREDGAKLLSSIDPLTNKDEIIKQWMYVACLKQVMVDIHAQLKDL
jgi:hypothetical protein